MEYANLSSREIAFLAMQAGMSVADWKAEQDRSLAGKEDDSTETTPPLSQQDMPAGESSSGNTSLESQEVQAFDPSSVNWSVATQTEESYMGVGPAYVNEFGIDRGAARAEEAYQEALTERSARVEALADDPEYQGNDQLFEAIDAVGETGGYGGVDETAGRKRLETLFGSLTSEWNNGGEGFDFVETTPMMDYVRVDYIDKDGIRHEGPELSFDEKDAEDIAANTKALKEFVALWEKNGDAKLSLDWENLTKEVREETDGLILPDERAGIEAKINEPDIFKPYWESTGQTDASRGAAMAGGYSASGQERTWVEPYKDELAYAKQEVLERNKKKGVEMTPDELDAAVKEQARKNIIATEIDELGHKKARAKLRRAGTAIVDPDGEYARSEFEVAGVIETSKINVKKDKLEYTEKRMTEVANMIEELGRHVQDPGALSEEELKNLTVRLLEHSIYIDPTDQELITLEDGTVMPRQYVKAFREMVDLVDGYNAVRDKHIDDLLSSLDEIEDLEIYRQEASKSYDIGDKALTEVAAGFGDLALGGAMLLSRTNLPLTIWAMADKDSMAAQMLNGVDGMLMNASMALQDWRDDYVANISFDEAFESSENFGLFALQEVSTQIPILTAMIASGGYASVVIGATSMGGNMIEMEIANKYGGEDYSDGEILLKSLGVGLAEGVFAELTTTRVLKNVKSKWAGVGKESALKNTRTQFIKDNYLELGLEPIAEATGEVLTAASQNLIMGRDMMEGLDHAGFSGFGMGLLMQAVPFMRGVYLSGNSSYASRQTIRDYQTDIARLTLELENATTPEAQAAIVEKIGRNQREMADEISRVEKLVNNNYRGVHAEKVRTLAGKQAEIQNEVAAIMQNKNLTKDQKQEQVDKLELEFQRLQRKKEASLDPRNLQKARPEFELLEDTEKGRYNRLLDEAQDALVKEKGENAKITDEQIKDKAYDLYFSEEVRKNNAEASNVEGAELTSFETKEELVDLITNDGIRFEADDTKNEVAKAEAINVINQGGDGFNVGNKQFVVVENQLENQRLHIGTHEVGHYVFDRLVKNNPKAFDRIAESLLKHTRNTDKALYKELSQETKGYEVISRFLEMVAAGKIDYREVRQHRGLLGMFGVNMQHAFKGEYNFDFKGEQDIVNFVVGMGKKISDGTLTIRDIEAAESGAAINKVKIEAEARKRKGIDIIKNTKFSGAADRAARQLAEMQEQGYDPNNFELYDILNGMVGAQLSKYRVKGLEITDMEEAVADVVGRLYTERDVNKFDGRGTLYGYLNGRIKFRILDAFKNNPIWVENFGDVDAEGLQGKEVQKLAVEAVEDTKTVADKPAYRSLTDAKTISMEGMRTIKEKVLSTVRVMKKRIDESVSKNVTVKPYIAELKKDFGKQVDIIVKKEMGGLKDRQLQKWLLKNKKAILENMTTTWMMTAMPNAIQKKVDGQWTSDWKGKKIDRESASTDNAGRTSGAELVRRLPMASINMSDADFLSNFLNADGSLIRGRKESLAKAIGEEISFELFSTELQTEGSPIREAFMMRQDLLQAALTENFATEVNRDIERGNVKFSRADVDTSLEGIDAYLRGDESVAEILFSKLPKALADRVTNFINDQLIGIGLEGFKSPLKNAVYPDSVSEILSTYLGGITNKKNKQAIDQMLDFTEELLDNLPPELVSHLPKDIFGMHYRYANHNQFKRAAALNARREAKANEASGADLPFNPAHIRIFQGGTGLMSQIVNNVLNKEFDTKEAKIEAFKEIAGLTVEEASTANKAALEYILNKTFEIVTKDPNKMVGVLRLFEGQTNMGQSLRGLTGLADVEFYAESQGAYYNTKTGKYYSTLSAAQKKKLGGEIVVNKNHPLYNDAVKYIEEFNTRSKKPSKLKPEDLLNFKGEHALPSAKMWFGIADIMLNRLAKSIDNPSTIEAERVAAGIEMKELVDQFDQQLNSILVSNIQDRVLGATSEVGDFRLGALSKSQQSAFHQTTDGQQTIGRVRRKMSEILDLNKYVEAVDELGESTKFSRSKPRAVFMVGGPGAGKTNVGKGLKLGRRGFKVVNQDLALEPMKEDAGLPANEQQYTKEQRSMRAKLGAAARKAAEAKMAKYANNHESMVVDGTGASYNATMKKINALREAGYEVSIVFANTSKAEAVSRNKARAERALPDFVVERTWDSVQESSRLFKEEFGDKFYELDTDALKMGENLPTEFLEKLYNDLDVNPSTKFSEAKKIDTEFNEMLERKTGMGAKKTFSKVQAELRGRKKGRFKWFVAPGADDFRGLVHYAFAGKGKQGDADMAWFEEKLMDPYFKGVEAINSMRQQIKRDFKSVIKIMRPQYKMLNKKIGDSEFTYDHAVRAYLWSKAGIEAPGLSKRDKKLLLDAVNKNPELAKLADALLVVSRKDQWAEPSDYWQNQTVLSDLNSMTEKIGRKKFLQEFIENAEVIFSEDNLNKIEALYGRAHKEAIKDALYSMKNGTNRTSGSQNETVNKFINWINGSTGAIMFFNRRSALLQMLSAANFINWSDNNPVKAAAAFANQKQYWSDWAMIFNSDKLKERRSGLKTDVSESELASTANRSKNDPQAILAYLLKLGFTPTQIADSMAISTGGASFYRNRVNKYIKQGLDKKEAEERAWLDFTKKSDEAQQSSDPALVSQQQRSVLGRLVFAFANTPMQYTRLMKKAAMDLKNGRGDAKESISKILYYGFVQNFIFSALQSALFAMLPGFDEEDEDLTDEEAQKLSDKEEAKIARVLNGMMDTILRGSGIYGAVGVTLKNTMMEYAKQEEKGFLADHTYTIIQATSISPPINSKLRKIYSAIQTKKFERDELEVRPWGVQADGRPNFGPAWSITGSLVSGALNVPLDRIVDEMNSIGEAMDARNSTWQRIALALGWKTWDVGAIDEEGQEIKAEGKERRKKEGVEKAKETRRKNKEKKDKEEAEAAASVIEQLKGLSAKDIKAIQEKQRKGK